MAYTVKKVKVRKIASLNDRPGAMAEKLEAAAEHKVNLSALFAYASQPGSPCDAFIVLEDEDAHGALADQGDCPVDSRSHAIMVTGGDAAGSGAEIARKIAASGVNARVYSAIAAGGAFGMLVGFDTNDDCDKALAALS